MTRALLCVLFIMAFINGEKTPWFIAVGLSFIVDYSITKMTGDKLAKAISNLMDVTKGKS